MNGGINRDDVNFSFSKSQSRLQRLNQARAIFGSDRDSILNDLNPRPKPFDFFWIGIDPHNFIVDPDSEVTLLLEKFEKLLGIGFGWNGNPKRNENRCRLLFLVI